MTNAQQATQANAASTELAPEVNIIEVHDPVFIQSQWGAVAVFGHELVSKKHLLITQHMLALDAFEDGDHQVRCINFRGDGLPMKGGKGVLGMADADSGAITINLMELFSRAFDGALNEPVYSIMACLHHEFMATMLHEIDHCARLYQHSAERTKAVAGEAAFIKELDDRADEWANAQMVALAKTVDIEPPHISESQLWATQMMEMLGKKTEDEDEWISRQRWMLENGVFMFKPGDEDTADYTLHSFKHYVCHLTGEDPASKEWAIATKTDDIIELVDVANADAEMETSVGVEVETPEPVCQVPQPVQVQPEAPVAAPSAPPVAPAANGSAPQFVSVQPDDLWRTQMSTMGMPEDLPEDEDTTYADYAEAPTVSSEPDGVVSAPPATYTPPVQQTAPVAAPAPTPVPQYATHDTGPAQNVAPPKQVEAVKPFPNNGLSIDETKRIMAGVYMKVYNHLFTMCGRGHVFPEYDASMQDGTPVFNVNKVHTMGIPLTEDEMKVVVKMDCLTPEGDWRKGMVTSGGMLFGSITKNTHLPMYLLHCNIEGNDIRRMLLPQNPAKMVNGQYTKTALEAQCGNAIMYVMEGNDDIANAVDPVSGARIGKKFLMKCVNGALEGC